MTWAYEREWVTMVMGSLYCDVPAYVASRWGQKGENGMITDEMRRCGFHVSQTGGGCQAWEKILPDGYIWITTGDGVSIVGPVNEPDWIIGRYRGYFWLCVTDCTFAQAVSLIERIPTPLGEDSISFHESKMQGWE